MKKLLFLCMLIMAALCASAQTEAAQLTPEQQAEYREKIGLDYSMPDYRVSSIDEKKLGSRLTNLLRFYEEVKS